MILFKPLFKPLHVVLYVTVIPFILSYGLTFSPVGPTRLRFVSGLSAPSLKGQLGVEPGFECLALCMSTCACVCVGLYLYCCVHIGGGRISSFGFRFFVCFFYLCKTLCATHLYEKYHINNL